MMEKQDDSVRIKCRTCRNTNEEYVKLSSFKVMLIQSLRKVAGYNLLLPEAITMADGIIKNRMEYGIAIVNEQISLGNFP